MGEDRNRTAFENASLMEAANSNFLICPLRSWVITETEDLLKMPASWGQQISTFPFIL